MIRNIRTPMQYPALVVDSESTCSAVAATAASNEESSSSNSNGPASTTSDKSDACGDITMSDETGAAIDSVALNNSNGNGNNNGNVENNRSKRRTMDPRCSTALGTDILGNDYHLFAPGPQRGSEWGSWVMCRKHKGLEHPTGEKVAAATPSEGAASPADDGATSKKATWYAVKGSEQINELLDWVRYKASIYWYEKKINEKEGDKKDKVDVDGDFKVIVVQRSTEEVPPAELATEESIKVLHDKLMEIRRFMAMDENEKAAKKRANLL